MFTPAQHPPVSYPYSYRIKRKPVPSLDFDFLDSESDLKEINNHTAIRCSSVDAASDLPRLSYHKPASPHMPPTPASLLATAGDTVPSWPKGRRSLDLNTHSVDVALIRDASTVQGHSECHAEPHYHKRAQSTSGVAPFQASLSSNPTLPYIYSHLRFDLTSSNISFPLPMVEIGQGVTSIDATHGSVVNLSSSQNRTSGSPGSLDLSLISPNTKSASEEVPASLTRPKELKRAKLLRPITVSLAMGTNDDPQSESRCHKSTYFGSTDRDRLSNPRPQPKRNVLRARRGRSVSLSSAGTKGSDIPLAKLGVNTEPGNLSQHKALAPPQLATDSSQQTLSALPKTCPGLASLGRCRRSHSQQLTSLVRPTTASAASVTFIKPTQKELSDAASLSVIAESGARMSFGELFLTRKTVVIFIRHFWCVSIFVAFAPHWRHS
jgi:hypothetical protein